MPPYLRFCLLTEMASNMLLVDTVQRLIKITHSWILPFFRQLNQFEKLYIHAFHQHVAVSYNFYLKLSLLTAGHLIICLELPACLTCQTLIGVAPSMQHNSVAVHSARIPWTPLTIADSQYLKYIDGLVQDCSNSIANAMELLQSCTKLSMCMAREIGLVESELCGDFIFCALGQWVRLTVAVWQKINEMH